MSTGPAAEPRPFVPRIDDADVADLRARLARTRWPEEATEPGDGQGLRLETVQALVERWRTTYDWSRLATRLASVPQLVTEIDGLGIHAVHVRSSRPDAVPLLLTHGWPSTCFEFLDLVPLLTEPASGPAFHLVAPSLPGYGWSERPASAGWGIERTADAWAVLMARLGYDRFLAHGGDWGAVVGTALARRHPDRVAGLHLTLPMSAASAEDRAGASASERRGLDREAEYRRTGSGYAQIQRTRPQTIGYALVDSPAGLCAWLAEKLLAWSGRGPDGGSLLSDDAVLDVVSVYWLTATGASAARLYREVDWRAQAAPVDVPTGCSIFPDEIIRPPRSAVARQYRRLCSWRELDRGGHFPAVEVPDLLAAELRAFGGTVAALEGSPVNGQANSCEEGVRWRSIVR
ncbi:epoxide hydrolase family protein [Nocardioides nitrophenolicus]|uniref:epoxide hydrolase family protein n=1 Tax=Nocardioides nitrophenolicus TaxID=60489 RepID=UPI00195B9257|nr:epoxide hydrolase family protein [Nocardioides nitrophenolicus]MBM7517980.1 pimeloyl-ACP methyl ester carboxylesterase [Nocardioides nitrophenolicus]